MKVPAPMTQGILDSKEGAIMVVWWMAIVFGVCVGTLTSFFILFLDFIKKENNKIQEINNEVHYRIDNMSPRDLYIHKLSQNNLIWDKTTRTYTKMEQK